MARRTARSIVLDVCTLGLVLVAVATLVHDRLLPALADRARLDPGDRLAAELAFRTVGGTDTVAVTGRNASLVVVFQSTCPVCEDTAPDWSELARLAPERVFAVGLEADSSAAAWVARKVSGVRAVVPLDPAGFMDRLRIRAVPTTLLFEGRRLTVARVGPLQPEDRARIHRAFANRTADRVRTKPSR